MTRVISFSSGKGGVGKTWLVANLGSLWAKSGKKILLVDADWTLGKLSLLFGNRKPQWTIGDVLEEKIKLEQAIYPINSNLFLLASPSGVVGLEELNQTQREKIFFAFSEIESQFDLILLDHSSGIHWGVIGFAAAAHQHIIVTTPEPTSYTDAYAIMKILSNRFAVRHFQLIVTMSHRSEESEKLMSRFVDFAMSQLNVRVELSGILPSDGRVAESIQKQIPLVEMFPLSDFNFQLEKLCQRLETTVTHPSHGLQFFPDEGITRGIYANHD